MEVSGAVFSQPPGFPCGIRDTLHHHLHPSSVISSSSSRPAFCGLSLGPRRVNGAVGSYVFRDNGHLSYYGNNKDMIREGMGMGMGMGINVRCGGGKKKEKEVSTKKKLKMLKGLSKDLVMFSEMGFGVDPDTGLVGEVQGKLVSEAAQVLMKQLEQLRAEEKELKRKKKEEKATMKAARMKTMVDSESSSSSSSSESSDDECGEVFDMNRLRNGAESASVAVAESGPMLGDLRKATQEEATLTLPVLLTPESNARINGPETLGLRDVKEGCCSGSGASCSGANLGGSDESSSMTGATSVKRIEVCMGNKCKRSGGAALLEEFGRVMGAKADVVGCKCMAKCRDGPNVRVFNSVNERKDDSVRTPANPLCIGVGLEDVGVIVSNFFGEEEKALDLAPSS